MSNKELAEELHKPLIRKFEKQKVHSHFMAKDNVWGANLDNMQLIKISIFITYYWYFQQIPMSCSIKRKKRYYYC